MESWSSDQNSKLFLRRHVSKEQKESRYTNIFMIKSCYYCFLKVNVVCWLWRKCGVEKCECNVVIKITHATKLHIHTYKKRTTSTTTILCVIKRHGVYYVSPAARPPSWLPLLCAAWVTLLKVHSRNMGEIHIMWCDVIVVVICLPFPSCFMIKCSTKWEWDENTWAFWFCYFTVMSWCESCYCDFYLSVYKVHHVRILGNKLVVIRVVTLCS